MKTIRIALSSLLLAILNITGILAGFIGYKLLLALRPGIDQVAVQAFLAAVLSIALFLLGWSLANRIQLRELQPQRLTEWVAVYFGSLLWTPLIFVPLHYLTQGYLTAPGNLVAIWMFQAPVNLLAIVAVTRTLPLRVEEVV